ncbi:MAG: glycosyltransferase family 39 protein [Chloroflexi bacterium]|nr:glycosyltransferase family 39 protein [Chloroflexota bacterium]
MKTRAISLLSRVPGSKQFWLLTLLSVFALGPLAAPGYFWGAHDARHSVYFLFEFNRAIADQWWPRWMPDFTFGYGYPFFNINSPLAYFAGVGFLRLGLDYVDATKLVFALAIMLSGWAMFGFVRSRLNANAALVAGLVYVYAPYHLVDVYVRAALAETVALVFLPLCLWAFAEAIERPRGAAVFGAALAYGGLMLAHSGVALLFSLLLAPYMAVLALARMHRDQPLNRLTRYSLIPLGAHLIHRSVAPLLALVLGIATSAIFMLPSLLELNFVRVDQYTTGTRERLNYYDFHNHFVYFFQLFSPRWGFGLSVPGPDDTMSFQLGAAATVLALVSLIVVVRKGTPWRPALIFFQVSTVVLVLMTLPLSVTVWDRLPLVAWAQFPWRFLALAALTMAPLAGAALAFDRSRVPGLPVLALAALVLLSSYPYVTAEIVDPEEGPVSFAGLMTFQRNAGELTGSTAWVETIPTWGPLGDVYLTNDAPTTQVDYGALPPEVVVDSRAHDSVSDLLWFRADKDSVVPFTRFMYPGWHAYLLDAPGGAPVRRLPVEPRGKLGLINVPVPAGEHFLLLRFEDTLARTLGAWLSVISLTGMGAWALWRAAVALKGRSHAQA